MTSAMERDSFTRTAGNGAPTDSGGQLQQAATGLMDQAARTADAQASTRMTMAGDTLEGISRAIADAAERLREEQPDLARLTSTAAERVQGAATYLRDHSASDALKGAQQLARQQPALVVGGGLLAGIVLGRFLRTGASVAQSTTGRRQLGGGSAYGASAETTYGYRATDTSEELLATDIAATGGSSASFDADVNVADLDGSPIDDFGGTGETRTGEGR